MAAVSRIRRSIMLCLLVSAVFALPNSLRAGERVDRIFVKKGIREMHLMSKDKTVRSYRISLGGNPKGHKVQAGDQRTPEGRYRIDYRNASSRFHLSLHISYPSAEDRKRAKERGVHPGGMIMIHGSPNGWQGTESALKAMDWTDGCIAVTNAEIEEIWVLVKDGTPIEIER